VCYLLFVLLFSNHTNLNYVNVRGKHVGSHVIVVFYDLCLCVRDQCSRTVASVKAKLHLMLRPYYILTQISRRNPDTSIESSELVSCASRIKAARSWKKVAAAGKQKSFNGCACYRH